jgi:1-acyl-sn-glycerol-3-phosphate acyltransferase
VSIRNETLPRSSGDAGRAQVSGTVLGWQLRFYQGCWAICMAFGCTYFAGGVEGREKLPARGPYIVAPVHRTYADWLIDARITRRRLRFIVKEEVWKSRFFGALVGLLGGFPVHRGGADREALRRCLEVLQGGEPLVLFPEGTRRSGPDVTDITDGAAYLALRAGVPIVPVGIGGAERLMPRGAPLPRPGRIRLVIGEPIDPTDAAAPGAGVSSARIPRSATKELTERVRAGIQASFDRAEDELAARRRKRPHRARLTGAADR